MKTTTWMKASLATLFCGISTLTLWTTRAHAWEVITEPVEAKVQSYYASAVNNLTGWKPTGIEINREISKNSYTKVLVAMVRNEGAHFRHWKFLYDKTPEQIADWSEEHGYTVVDFEEYEKAIFGAKRYAALLYKYSPLVNYFMYAQTNTAWLNGFISGNGGKVVDMDMEEDGQPTLHGVVRFDNLFSGTTWDSTMTLEQIWDYKVAHHKRVLDLQQRMDGAYCALFADEKPGEAGKTEYFYNANWNWVKTWPQAHGYRVQNITYRRKNNVTTYSGALVVN